LWREETATAADKARNSQAMKLAIMAPSIRLQKEFVSSQTAVHRSGGAFTPCLPTHPIASAADAADTSAFASNCSVNTCRGVPQTKPNQTKQSTGVWIRVELISFANTVLLIRMATASKNKRYSSSSQLLLNTQLRIDTRRNASFQDS